MTLPAESDPYEEKSSLTDDLEAVRITSIEERRGKVLLMKTAGATFATIADECKVSVATVRKDYGIALAAQAAHWTPEKRIMRQSAVLTDVLRFNYPAMMQGDKDAAVTILRALDREAKLFGLDAPQRVIADINPVDFANETARLITRIQHLDPTTLKELTSVGYQPRPDRTAEVIEGEVEPDPAGPGPGGSTGTPAHNEDFPEHPEPTFTEADRRRARFRAVAGTAAGDDPRPRDRGDDDAGRVPGQAPGQLDRPGEGTGQHRIHDAGGAAGGPGLAEEPALRLADDHDTAIAARDATEPGTGRAGAGTGDSGLAAEADDLDGWSNIE